MHEAIVDDFVGVEDRGAAFAGHGFGVDGVAVVVIQQEELSHACAGREDEAASLISEDLAGGRVRNAGGVAEVGAFGGAVGGESVVERGFFGAGRAVVKGQQRELGVGFSGWLLVAAGLVEVAFDGGDGLRRVAAQKAGSEAGEICKEVLVEGALERRERWGEKRGVGKCNKLGGL
jgi:hypothetical protein